MHLSFPSEGHIGLERKVTKLEAMVKMLQEDLKKVRGGIYMYLNIYAVDQKSLLTPVVM